MFFGFIVAIFSGCLNLVNADLKERNVFAVKLIKNAKKVMPSSTS